MALQSEVSPPIVGDTNKDTKIDGDTKSIDNDTSQDTEEEEVDLEEGEILDSGEEEEDSKENTQSQLKEALDIKLFKTIEKLAASPAKTSPEKNVVRPNVNSQRQAKKIYLDHDRIDDNEDDKAWSPHSLRPKAAQKFNEGPIDYRKELDAYRGSPSSSPDRKRGRSDKARKKKSKSSKSNRKRKEKKGLRDSKTRRKGLCRYYKEGKCSKGSDCQFAHIGPTKKRELCKFYISNTCFKGKSCIYMHDDFPCKFYHTNTRCYADEKCRYSHKPLTEETKALLAEYLGGQHHGNNDDYDNRDNNRKRHRSPTPEPPPPIVPVKRPCLLGSPPRHIKEAEETRRWQEEMMMLQQQNQPGFEIHIGPEEEIHYPEDHEFTKPNFYADTLQNSPIPHPRFRASSPVSEHRMQGYPEFDESMMPPRVKIKKEEEEGKNWINIDSLIQQLSGPNDKPLIKEEPGIKHELDFTSDVKFDETTQFSEMGMPMNLPHPMPPYNTSAADDDEEDNEEYDDGDEDENSSSSDQASNQDSPNRDASEEGGPSKPLPPPIVIPNHLPRKQRELFLRIQQHQRRNITTPNASGSPSSDDKPEAQDAVNEEEEMEKSEEKKQSKWYSSEEDDDDDTDRPLANVLKKLREEPPKQVSPVKPSINLIQMLSNISQNDNSKPLMDAQHSQQGAFWESILTGAVPPSMGLAPPVPMASNLIANRRTLLPDPQMLPPPSIVEKKEVVLPKDPRLKRRDPRTRAVTTLPNVPVVPTVTIPGIAPDLTTPPPLLPPIALIPQQQQPKVNELTKLFPKPVETVKESIPYKLHGIFTKPPNYMPYIHASQSDPKLLNDPRLRRHILQVVPAPHHAKESAPDVSKVVPIKEAPPPIPPLLLQYGKPDSKLSIDIFEPNPTPKAIIPKPTEPKLLTAARRLSDPRIRTRDILLDQIGTYGSTTPPHLTIHEPHLTPPLLQEFKSPPAIFEDISSEQAKPELKWQPPILENWLPPVLEKNLPSLEVRDGTSPPPQLQRVPEAALPPSLIKESSPEGNTIEPVKKVVPKTASHLPRAIADPRMAKLHHPLDPRRRRVTADVSAISGMQVKVAVESAEVKVAAESDEVKLETADLRIKEETDVKVKEYPGLKFIKDEPLDNEPVATIKEEPIDIEPVVKIKEPVCDEINEPGLDIRDFPGLISKEKSGIESEQEFELKIKDEPVVKDEPVEESKDEQINPKIENTITVKETSISLNVEPAEVNPIKKKSGCIPKKRKAIEKSDEKKKTVHRNRKSSMDYASPLNSCDDNNSTNTLGYNSYNQRLRQRTAKPSSSASSVPVDNRIDVAPMISEFLLSDGSNQECDSSDVNLKDMFKTIDPTASPFC